MRILAFLFFSVSLLFKNSFATDIFDKLNVPSVSQFIHDPEKIEKYPIPFPRATSSFELDTNSIWSAIPKGWDLIFESNMRIVQNENLILYTNDIQECVGITVWDPLSKTAALFHASRMYLSDNSELFKKYFISRLNEKIKDFSQAEVNLVSCYWSKDAHIAINLLKENGIPISGLDIPDTFIERSKLGTITRYMNKNTVPSIYTKTKGYVAMAMALNTATGKIGFKRY